MVCAVDDGGLLLNAVVTARLLLHEQSQVVGHQVNTSLQSQRFADERRLQQRMLTVVVGKQFADHLFKVLRLLAGIVDEALTVEVVAGTELHGLFAERAPQRLRDIISLASFGNDIVEGCASEVSQ